MKVFFIKLLQSNINRKNLFHKINSRGFFSLGKYQFLQISKPSFKLFSNKSEGDKDEKHCHNESCGCHPEDELEKTLKGINYQIVENINSGKFNEALELSEEFIDKIKTNFGEDHPFFCSAINNKAFILKTCGEFEEARALFEEVIEKYKKIYGPESEKVIITMHNLATLHRDAKETDKALQMYEELLKLITKENVLNDNISVKKNIIANVYNSAGGLYRQLKNYEKSDNLFNLALNIIKENHGENTLPAATVLNNFGLSLKDQGKHLEALDMYSKAYEIRKKNLKEDHPDLLAIKHNIEVLKKEMNKI